MQKLIYPVFLTLILCSTVTAQRDPLKWPFEKTSIWNMPIHNDAVLVPAEIPPKRGWGLGLTEEEDVIVLTPDAPLNDIYRHGWTQRCQNLSNMYLQLPIPESFVVHKGGTPNFAAAILMPDGETLVQNQPFHKCQTGLVAYSRYKYPSVSIYGDGIEGAHGGSGMSSIGGAIRLGELVPGGEIKHALKMNLYAKKDLYYRSDESDGKPGYRWPAVKADGYASATRYAGTNSALQIGSLLALSADFDLSTLSTEPAKIMARALMNYGAYVVDDTAWDVYAFALEWSPEGRVMTEFRDTWGYNFNVNSTSHPWAVDIWKVVSSLYVVDNNDPENIGGGPTSDTINRRAPMAPDFAPASVSSVSISPTALNLNIDETSQLTATVYPSIAANKKVTWSTSDTSIALVDSTGLVTAIAPGTVEITVTTEEEEKTDIVEITVTDPSTSLLEENGSSQFSIYPNPLRSNEFSIETPPHFFPGNIAIYNMLGEMVLSKHLEEGTLHTIHVSHLSRGIYMVKASNKGMSFSKKLMVAK